MGGDTGPTVAAQAVPSLRRGVAGTPCPSCPCLWALSPRSLSLLRFVPGKPPSLPHQSLSLACASELRGPSSQTDSQCEFQGGVLTRRPLDSVGEWGPPVAYKAWAPLTLLPRFRVDVLLISTWRHHLEAAWLPDGFRKRRQFWEPGLAGDRAGELETPALTCSPGRGSLAGCAGCYRSQVQTPFPHVQPKD